MSMQQVKQSPEFEKQVKRSVAAIVFFVLVYLILLSAAFFIAGLGVVFGFMLGVAVPSLVTIGLAIGLAGAGAFVLVFLLKFLFKRHKVDRSSMREITRQDEPELFAMIDDIVKKVGTNRPKKVYLSDQVNASVFYDSGFWSMFLPVEKNLEIGLGLVNSVTQSELKAILAHEFGHFSQRSMKVGSYVYQVNQVIFNMLYDNSSFDDAVSSWAQTSPLFTLPILGAYRIIQGIQWVLVQMYGVVNRSYLALSREMEFHADEIAAHVTGAQPLKTSLLRAGFANDSHQATLQFFADNAATNCRVKNLFHSHSACMNQLAERNELSFEYGLPKIDFTDLNKFNRSKLVVTDQWASHPGVEERINRLDSLGLPELPQIQSPANDLFQKLEEHQEFFSEKFFSFFEENTEPMQISVEDFEQKLLLQWANDSFPEFYNDYYLYRNIEPFELNATEVQREPIDIAACYSTEKLELVYTSNAMNQDILGLKFILDNPKSVKSFDYDGEKFGSKASKYLIQRLEKEYAVLNQQLLDNERTAFVYFHNLEQKQQGKALLKSFYERCFDFHNALEERSAIFNKIDEATRFMRVQTSYEVILHELKNLKKIEATFKGNLSELLDLDYLAEFVSSGILDAQIFEDIEFYCSKDWEYFGGSRYIDENLEVFNKAVNIYHYLLTRIPFLLKKQLLEYQVGLLSRSI